MVVVRGERADAFDQSVTVNCDKNEDVAKRKRERERKHRSVNAQNGERENFKRFDCTVARDEISRAQKKTTTKTQQ